MAQVPEAQMIGLLQMTPSQSRVGWRRGRTAQWISLALAWLMLVGAIFLLQRDSEPLRDFPSSDPRDLLLVGVGAVVAILLVPLIVIFCDLLFLPKNATWAASRTIRAAAMRGDDGQTQIPLASEQPSPLSPDQLPQDMGPFSALKMLTGPMGFLSIMFLFIFLCLIGFAVLALVYPEHNSIQQLSDLLQFVGPLLLMVSVVTRAIGSPLITEGWSSALPSRRARLLAIDEQGIHWRARGWRRRERTLAWQDIAAFCVFHTMAGSTSRTVYAYMLLSDELSFAWTVTSKSAQSVRSASELLGRLVVTRTGRPLLDVTKAVETLDVWAGELQETAGQQAKQMERREPLPRVAEEQGKRSQPFQASGYLRELLDESVARHACAAAEMEQMAALHWETLRAGERMGRPIRPLRISARFYGLNVALMVALAMGMVSLWSVNQTRRADYYRTLPARITATPPLYRDAMTGTGGWFVQPPTVDDPSSYGYRDGGYEITGGRPGYINYVTMGGLYADVVVAVTVRQIGTAENDGVGLVARDMDTGADYDDQIIFYLSPTTGEWTLYHYQAGHHTVDENWRYLDGGYDTQIHRGQNIANRLMLALRGGEYLCYINGQFVARVVDSTLTPSSPKSGYVGVYINDAVTGVFSDFAIYAPPPPYQPLLGGL